MVPKVEKGEILMSSEMPQNLNHGQDQSQNPPRQQESPPVKSQDSCRSQQDCRPSPGQPSYASADHTKLFSILAYLPLLWLVGLLADRNNPKVMYHVNQGILFNIVAVVLNIVINIVSIILTAILPILVVITGLLELAVMAIDLMWFIMGIINVCNGVEKPLPVIGTIATIVK